MMWILLIDPDVLVRSALAVSLRKRGCRVCECAETREAKQALTIGNLQFDWVLCRVTEGRSAAAFHLVRWLKSNRPDIVIKLVGGIDSAVRATANISALSAASRRPSEGVDAEVHPLPVSRILASIRGH